MKISTVILLLLLPAAVVAQNFPGMTEADMQKIQKMQSCIEKINQEELKSIERRQNQFDAEVKALCANGKRDEAQKKAILYEKEMMKNPVIKALSKCGEMAKGMMPEMPFMNQAKKGANEHICDQK
jgi:hypothetical protein